MNRNPIYPEVVRHGMARIATANTAFDGSGTLGSVITGAKGGTLVSVINVRAIADTTAGCVNLFIDDGSSVRLYHTFMVSATTFVAGTTARWSSDLVPEGGEGLFLPEGYILKASTYTGDDFDVHCEAGDFQQQ